MKNDALRFLWLVALVVVAAFFLFFLFTGHSSRPTNEDEFPPAESPPPS